MSNIFDELAKDKIRNFKEEVVEHSRKAAEAWASGRNEYGYLCTDLIRVDDCCNLVTGREELREFVIETYKESDKECKEGKFKYKDCNVETSCLNVVLKILNFISYDDSKWNYDGDKPWNGQSVTIERSTNKGKEPSKLKINFNSYGRLKDIEQINSKEG